ncbi:nucleolar protein 12 isoform X2 [Erinaceus europaeus]|uniref:Nucleolar protein 12 n=1 Tax=Erinaceus europaeus TaxID=9365 RepID=A0A1S3W7P8_ERIEU|nr:nucleolar protein 12 isoform X2 [Erinaceus europaeus]
MGRKKKRNADDRRPRLVLSFDEEKRREYLTGFHKRKVERKKIAIEEIKQRLKQEQKKLREERHQEYLKMLAEREEALARGRGGSTNCGQADQIFTPEIQRPPAVPADLLSHGIPARTQSQKGQEETSSAGTGLHKEAPECHSYQQDPAPSTDGQSPAQCGVSPENQAPGKGLLVSTGCSGA